MLWAAVAGFHGCSGEPGGALAVSLAQQQGILMHVEVRSA
jgi:hypothetical protein